jgi:hypothetical protein
MPTPVSIHLGPKPENGRGKWFLAQAGVAIAR